ncbi:hypothetical protein DW322_07605 [Rhodococcus rhodnii]|uniref:Uncharacterized protein n=2 Tax=Rhodococcus rhodnii TaxID=38312 RepID=R7WRZ4_9NOCA|nr:hypothetical protein [Rhodococcus rhodnii]EOM78107.1 hypothetical protein Rrhod_0532 [Rhodococcus rhodnii LMG 5362]TXG90106.1 hypothetical protein DW322_07605 [Rhodococcus rhodnii]
MTEPDHDTTHGPAPGFDMAGHFRSVARVLPVALALGLLAAAGLAAARAFFVADEFEAIAVAQVRTADRASGYGDAYTEHLRAPYEALLRDPRVSDSAAERAETTTDGIVDRIESAAGRSPEILELAATGPSPEQASALAAAFVDALDHTMLAIDSEANAAEITQMRSSLAVLDAELGALPPGDPGIPLARSERDSLAQQLATAQAAPADRLLTLSVSADPDPVSPRPIAEGSVAAVVVTILAAEILVLVERRWRSRPAGESGAASERAPAEGPKHVH